MRYHIDTIPVWDAQKLEGECLLCALKRRTELGEAERYLGASVMEPDIRVRVNDKGFCRAHQAMLFTMSNRLGHALMLESHTIETRERLQKACEEMNKAAEILGNLGLGEKLTGKAKAQTDVILKQAEKLQAMTDSCIMCETIEENMLRYLHTFFHLYKNDAELKRRFLAGKGVCMPHYAQLLKVAVEELSSRELAEFVPTLNRLEQQNMDRMQEDISWFIKKFDYRFTEEPWKDSKDAVERTVNKVRGWCVGPEPNPEEK